MTLIALSEKDSSLAITCDADGDGDYLVSVEAKTHGFAGHADGHVAGSEWEQFVVDLRKLEETRKGAARFGSALPGEFEVLVRAIDLRGHMGVSGVLQYRSIGVEDWSQQQLRFAFEFDPSLLPALVESANAAQQGAPRDAPQAARP
jgi:hypothetical protein